MPIESHVKRIFTIQINNNVDCSNLTVSEAFKQIFEINHVVPHFLFTDGDFDMTLLNEGTIEDIATTVDLEKLACDMFDILSSKSKGKSLAAFLVEIYESDIVDSTFLTLEIEDAVVRYTSKTLEKSLEVDKRYLEISKYILLSVKPVAYQVSFTDLKAQSKSDLAILRDRFLYLFENLK